MYDRTILETIEYHRTMLADKTRMQSYLRAILHTVKPGDVVLDIGSGTGILAYFACMAGARRVYAVEQDPVVELAKAIRDHNGFQDRVIFLNEWSDEIELPETADVLVTETIGNIGFEEGILGWIIDAKERLLAQDSRIIPGSVELMVAPVEIPDAYGLVHDWTKEAFTLDFSPAKSIVANNLLWITLSPNMFVSDPASIIQVETAGVKSPDLSGESLFVAGRDGTVGGLGCWFKSELVPGITISNDPSQKGSSWTQILLPLERSLPVSAGDRLDVQIQASANSAHWNWQIGSDRRQFGQNGQSTLSGQLVNSNSRNGLAHAPARNADGAVDFFILQMMDGTTTVKEMARRMADRFPMRFGSFEQALEHVQQVSNIYGTSA